jgi:hypothetical protein
MNIPDWAIVKDKQVWVSYNIALLLKSKGFDVSCRYHFKVSTIDIGKHSNIPTFEIEHPFGANHNHIPTRVSAPEWSVAIDWVYKKTSNIIIYNPTFSMEFFYSEFDNALKRI